MQVLGVWQPSDRHINSTGRKILSVTNAKQQFPEPHNLQNKRWSDCYFSECVQINQLTSISSLYLHPQLFRSQRVDLLMTERLNDQINKFLLV